MKFRFPAVISVVVLLSVLALPVMAQLAPAPAGNDVSTHKFQPAVSPRSLVAPQAQTRTRGLQPSAVAQIQSLMAERNSRTYIQKKISSRVLQTVRMMQGMPVASGVQYLETGVDLDANNLLVLDIRANVTPALIERIRATGSYVDASWPQYRAIRARVPASQVENIAAFGDVLFILPKQEAETAGIANRHSLLTYEQRAASVRSTLTALLPAVEKHALIRRPVSNVVGTGQGSQTSEGDATHMAAWARAHLGVSGAALKIGVLSDGVDSLALSQGLGDLPTVTVLPGQQGSGDEGTAMLEIVHDLAPDAQLYFATAFGGIEGFAQNIHDLRAAGCDIIVDDVSYYLESRFQDGQSPSIISTYDAGVVIQAVNDVVGDGAFYFSSAANSGAYDWGTSGTWEGDYVDGASVPPLGSIAFPHPALFDPTTPYDTLTYPAGVIVLTWADPLGASNNDYDLIVTDPTGNTVVAASADFQTGTQDPFEAVGGSFSVGDLIIVNKYAGVSVFFHLATNRGELAIATNGATYGHNAAKMGYSVAATPAYVSFGPTSSGWPAGPYPGPFTAANLTEPFSSDGPRHIYFNADGSPVNTASPADFTHTGGQVVNKPDFTAADGVSVTGVGGFGSPFFGTSAAAPHAAALAALVRSAFPTLSAVNFDYWLKAGAIDIMGTGWDQDSGVGILMANGSTNAFSPPANPNLGAVEALENPGNSNGYIEPGEGVTIQVSLNNLKGNQTASNITATLESLQPTMVTVNGAVQPPSVSYPNLPKGTGDTWGSFPFYVTLLSNFPPCATTADFKLTVHYSGGPSPTRALYFSVPVGPPPTYLTNNLGTTPAGMPDITGLSLPQDGRLFRDGVPTTCATTPKTYPGTIGTGTPYAADQYIFGACRDVCVPFEVANPSADPALATVFFTAVYVGTYSPSSLGTGYIGDSGVSAASESDGIQIAAGNGYLVVVNEVTPGAGVGQPYQLTIPSCAYSCATLNQVPVAVVQNVTVAPDPGALTATTGIDNGSYDPDSGVLTYTQIPASPYPVGTRTVTLMVTDPEGATAQGTATVTVTPIPTGLTIAKTAPANPVVGVGFTLLASFNSGNGATGETGTVSFYHDGLPTPTNVPATGPSITLDFGAGAHTVYATYSGDANFVGSTSAPITITEAQTTTTTVVTSSAAPSYFGQSVNLTATVTGVSGFTPTGTVQFMDGAATLGTPVAVNTSSKAVYTTSTLSVASHSISAQYWGDVNYLSSNGSAITQVVNAANFSVVAANSTLQIPRGTSSQTVITGTALGSFTTALTFSCGTLPQYATCTFTPSSATWSGGTTSTILVVGTGATLSGSVQFRHSLAWLAIFTIGLPGLLLVGNRKRLTKRTLMATLLLMVALTLTLGVGACGSTASKTTPAGTYSIPVTVSGGSTSHVVSISVIVE